MIQDRKQKEWYIIDDRNNDQYGLRDENDSTVKFDTDVVKSFLVDYSDAYILVTGDIKIVGANNNNTRVAFKNYDPFIRAIINLNNEHVETSDHLDLTMNLHKIIDYSDNYTGSLYHYKRPDQTKGDDDEVIDIADTSTSFKYQWKLIKKQEASVNVGQNIDPVVANAHKVWKNVKIAMPLKYTSNGFRKLEVLLINTELYMELNWTKHSIISNIDTATTFQITKTELYVPVVTLSTVNNKKLASLLSEGFERLVTLNEYKSKIDTVATVAAEEGNTNTKRILLDTSFQGVNRLSVMGFDNNTIKRNTADADGNSHRRYYLPRIEIKNYNILIDGRKFFDQNVNDSITRYTELLKLTTGRSEDYSTGCLIDYDYFLNDFKIAAIDLSHQSVLNSDPKVIQQIEFAYKIGANLRADIFTVLEKEKKTRLEFSKGTIRVY